MSGHICSQCGVHTHVFGQGGGERLAKKCGFPSLVVSPLIPKSSGVVMRVAVSWMLIRNRPPRKAIFRSQFAYTNRKIFGSALLRQISPCTRP